MPTFEDYVKTDLSPAWLREGAGAAYQGTLGARIDAHVGLLKEAVKARMPSLGPSDALALLAAERGIDRGTTETEASHRDRVKKAWEIWRWAGTPIGMLIAFYWAGYRPTDGRVVIQTQGDATAGGHQFELRTDFDPAIHAPEDSLIATNIGPISLGGAPAELWQDFAVIFTNPIAASWGGSLPLDASLEVDNIRGLITRWKAGHSRCVRLRATTIDLWDLPLEPWDPTTEPWDEAGATTDWTPPT
jgi:hypothetical protein